MSQRHSNVMQITMIPLGEELIVDPDSSTLFYSTVNDEIQISWINDSTLYLMRSKLYLVTDKIKNHHDVSVNFMSTFTL